jgi:putative transcriptional regulator
MPELDIAKLRKSLGLSQPQFASKLHVGLGLLRAWEQGRRRPSGPARVLLRVIAKNPDAIDEILGPAKAA